MSYILDALQRADAERARGGVPGLHSRQTVATETTASGLARLNGWWLLAGAVILGAIGGGLWWTRTPASAPVSATPIVLAEPRPAHDVQVLAPPPAAAPTPAPAATPVAPPAVVPLTAQNVPTALLAQAAKPRPVEPVAPPVQTSTIAPKPASSVPVANHTSANAHATPAAAIPWLADVPPDIRQQIPKLTITGTVYSDNPAQRLLVVNGQVLSQGSEVAPELSLVEIHQTNSDFQFRGTRFRVAH